jgi:hypothetical protein
VDKPAKKGKNTVGILLDARIFLEEDPLHLRV